MVGRPSPSRTLLFLTIAGTGLAVDLITKEWIFRRLGAPGTSHASGIWWLWEGYVGFQTALNRGALFGIGQGRVAWFAGLSVAAVCGILYWFFVRGAWRDLWLTVTLGCILGGILGNLYDRLGLWTAEGLEGPTYAVRDWILLTYRQYVWPNFNIADSLLVCGAAMLIWHSFSAEGDAPHTKRSTPEN